MILKLINSGEGGGGWINVKQINSLQSVVSATYLSNVV